MKSVFYKFVLFCAVGVLAALVELGFFNIFYFINLGFPLSKFLGIFFALCFNFLINRRVTFSATNGLVKKQISKFIFVYAGAFLVNFGVSLAVNSVLPQSNFYVNLAVVSGIVAQIPISFFGSLLWAFKE